MADPNDIKILIQLISGLPDHLMGVLLVYLTFSTWLGMIK